MSETARAASTRPWSPESCHPPLITFEIEWPVRTSTIGTVTAHLGVPSVSGSPPFPVSAAFPPDTIAILLGLRRANGNNAKPNQQSNHR